MSHFDEGNCETERESMGAAGLLILFPFLMAYAASQDLLTMRIPNWISVSLLIGFAAVAASGYLSLAQIGSHLASAGLVLLVSFVLFARGIIGGGDAKFAAMIALWFGLSDTLDYLLVASVLGGALTFGILYARSRPLPQPIANLPFAKNLHDENVGVPYGIALAAGALIVLPSTTLWWSVFVA